MEESKIKWNMIMQGDVGYVDCADENKQNVQGPKVADPSSVRCLQSNFQVQRGLHCDHSYCCTMSHTDIATEDSKFPSVFSKQASDLPSYSTQKSTTKSLQPGPLQTDGHSPASAVNIGKNIQNSFHPPSTIPRKGKNSQPGPPHSYTHPSSSTPSTGTNLHNGPLQTGTILPLTAPDTGQNLQNGPLKTFVQRPSTAKPPQINKMSKTCILCPHCNRHFSNKSSLPRHMRRVHPDTKAINMHKKLTNSRFSCNLCPLTASSVTELIEHCNREHHRNMTVAQKLFSNEEEFNLWKSYIEKSTLSRYVLHHGRKTSANICRKYYYCHRSGLKRTSKLGKAKSGERSCKLDSFCTSFIRVSKGIQDSDSSLFVEYCLSHHNHSPSSDSLPLSRDVKLKVIEKLVQGFEIEEILEYVRHGTEFSDRDKLITRQDIRNIRVGNNISKRKEKKKPTFRAIMARHKRARCVDRIKQISESKWSASSSGTTKDGHQVHQLMPEACGCKFICKSCYVCVHMYSCSCEDFLKKDISCEHIHAVHMAKRKQQLKKLAPSSAVEEKKVELEMLQPQNEVEDTDAKIRRLKTSCHSALNDIINLAQNTNNFEILEVLSETLQTTYSSVSKLQKDF